MALGDLNEKQLLAVTVGVVTVLLAGMGGLVLWAYMRYADQKGQIDEVQKKIYQVESRVKELPRKSDELRKQKEEHGAKLKMVPETDEVDELIDIVNKAGQMCNLTYQRSTPPSPPALRKGERAPEYPALRFSYEFVGSYVEFGRFITKIETEIERLVAVKGLKITGMNDGLVPGAGGLTFAVDLEAYRLQKPPTPK